MMPSGFHRRLVIRADANPNIGAGHVMRCLALAQFWRDQGGRLSFVMSPGAGVLEQRIRDEGMEVFGLEAPAGSPDDADAVLDLARRENATAIVVDGYQFGAPYHKALKAAGAPLMVIDDYGHAEHYHADAVLNQNIGASESMYPRRDAAVRLLLGTRYALLRREFRTWRGWRRQTPDEASKLLVTLGGSDPHNVTLKVIEALSGCTDRPLEAAVVVGGTNPNRDALSRAAQASPADVRMYWNVPDMTGLMAWADLAVSAGGSTSWELAFMGLPSVTIVLADNQRLIAEGLDRAGATRNLGWFEGLSPARIERALADLVPDRETRETMSRTGRNLVDGLGVERVADVLAEMAEGAHANTVSGQ